MPTSNPKVSAYVPQYIFDRFKAFYKERQLSMSQAVAVIFAEYFQLSKEIEQGSSPESRLSSGLLFDRLVAIEERVLSLSSPQHELIDELSNKIDELAIVVSSLDRRVELIESSSLSSELFSEPQVIVDSQSDSESGDENFHSIPVVTVFSETSIQTQIFSEPPSSLLSKPISSKLLCTRLLISPPVLSAKKANFSEHEFYQWITSKDPDQISWKAVGSTKGYSKGYLPVIEGLSNELLSRLLDWLKKNVSH